VNKIITTVFILVVIALPTVGTLKPYPTGLEPLPKLAIPNGLGVNIHFRCEPRDLDLIAEAGFKFIRMDLTWSGIEQDKGVYDFEKLGYDALIKGCTKRDIRILYILDYSNKLYEPDRSVRSEA